MKDYSAVAGQLGVTHILAISQTKSSVLLRIGRHPEGPTLHFRILKYSLSRQVRALQKRPYECPGACKSFLVLDCLCVKFDGCNCLLFHSSKFSHLCEYCYINVMNSLQT